MKAALANSVWSKLKKDLSEKKNFAKKQSCKKLRKLKKSFRKESEERKERGRRQAEEFEEKRRKHAEELEKHRLLIEKRRSEAMRERELEILPLRHRHEVAELKRSILDNLPEGKSNITINHTQCRSEAECRPGPTIKAPPFPPLKFVYKNVKGKKIVFHAYLTCFSEASQFF